jgi:hypothetical protein
MNGLQDVVLEEEDATSMSLSLSLSLSIEQKEQFLRDGILVVENVLSKNEIQKAIIGLNETLSRHGVNVDSLTTTTTSTSVDDDDKDDDDNENDGDNENDDGKEVVGDEEENVNSSARSLQQLSTTNGSGGVLDIFYEDWKLDICQKENLFRITTQLWEASFATCNNINNNNNNNCCDGKEEEGINNNESSSSSSSSSSIWWSPYGSFDYSKGYMYIDRICYRLPTKIAEKLGEQINGDSNKKKKMKKSRSLQRSLTPHLDCCPDTFFDKNKNKNDTATATTTETKTKTETKKWRPIQCFVSLTDNLEANTGGFEAAKGFHKDFHKWSQTRIPTIVIQKNKDGSSNNTEIPIPAACVGEYTHMRPKEDRDVMDRVCHIPVPAGSAVFWDNRIPHSNAYTHNGTIPRAVVYCSFLPDVELNRCYVQNQLLNYQQNKPVKDQWNHISDDVVTVDDVGDQQKKYHYNFTSLGRKLMGIDTWI